MSSPGFLSSKTKTRSSTKTKVALAITIASAAAFAGYLLSQQADTICQQYPTFCDRFTLWNSSPSLNGEGTSNSNGVGGVRDNSTRTFNADQKTTANEIENTLVPNPDNGGVVSDPVQSGGSGSDPVSDPVDPVQSGGSGSDPVLIQSDETRSVLN